MYCLTVLLVLSTVVFSVVQCDIYRLPKNVKPVRYTLTMEPHLDSNLREPVPYDGNIVMELKIIESTKSVTFHKKTFTLDNSTITVFGSNGAAIKPVSTTEDEDTETYTIYLENELIKGQSYKLTIGKFTGFLASGKGFFLASYWKEYPEVGGIAVTHFEPSGARTAFPCFDEPALKANFIIKLIRREGYNSVSNEALDNTENLGNGRFMDTFKETPKMSSYLVAFVISEFTPTEKVERHRVFAEPRTADERQLNYSIRVAIKALKNLEEYTGIDFPLSKLDHFALPRGTFDESAMENWGLIIYVETYLFDIFDSPYQSHQQDVKRCTLGIVHEITHQWFGDLVTPEWWDYIWLSESFAAYFQYYMASFVQPTWKLMNQFVVDVVQKAFREEELKGAHPLIYRIWKTGTYPPFYIMYEKGGSILRMAANFLTPEVFQKGLQLYLEKGKFASTVPSDLYTALQETVNKKGVNNLLNNLTVAEIFGPWTTNEGFPLVTVTRDYNSGSITLEQEPRTANWRTKGNWKVPITYFFSSSNDTFSKTMTNYWLIDKTASVNHNFPTDGWLIINKQQIGYYRVNYDMENWERLIKVLNSENFESIHELNRAQLIDDSFNLAHDKTIPPDTPLRMCEYLVRERDYIPWAAFFQGVSRYISIYHSRNRKNPEQSPYFQKFAQKNNLNSSLHEYGVFQEYIRFVTSGMRGYLTARSASEDSHLDSLTRYEINKYFPMYFSSKYHYWE